MSSQFYTARHYNAIAESIAEMKGVMPEPSRYQIFTWIATQFEKDSTEHNGRFKRGMFKQACKMAP